MVIVETPVFTKLIDKLMDEDEYKALQETLISNPDKGAIIKHSGGLRKLRWSLESRGKSRGARIIYYWMNEYDQLYMLLAYPKNAQSTLTDSQLKQLRQIVARW